MNQYQNEVQKLEQCKCTYCSGTGKLDDADFGDIYYNTWECQYCKGTGIKAISREPPTELQRKVRESIARLRSDIHKGPDSLG